MHENKRWAVKENVKGRLNLQAAEVKQAEVTLKELA